MLKSEVLPKKFIIPIIFLMCVILMIPVGNVVNNTNSDDSEEEKWNQTVVIAVFSLSVALGGIIIYVIIVIHLKNAATHTKQRITTIIARRAFVWDPFKF